MTRSEADTPMLQPDFHLPRCNQIHGVGGFSPSNNCSAVLHLLSSQQFHDVCDFRRREFTE